MATHCWIAEQISNGPHAKMLMYSRFAAFIASLEKCEKPQVRALLEHVKNDSQQTTGSNIRSILMDTGIKVSTGHSNKHLLKQFSAYPVPEESKWKIKFVESLIEIRDQRWEVLFDEEEDGGKLSENEVTTMIDRWCIS